MVMYGRVLAVILYLFLVVDANELSSHQIKGKFAESARRGAQWLLNRRNSQLDWGHLTNPQVLLALSQSDINSNLLEIQLAIKQLDINFLLDRLKHGDLELYSDKLIPLAVTLTSLCRSATNYYDYDLLDGLLDYRRKTDNFTFASEMLAVCSGDGVMMRRTHIRRLVWILNSKMWTGPSIDIDTLSMVVMATGCVAQRYNHPYILPFADQVVTVLVQQQNDDGSFNNGNTFSTALAVQALRINGLTVHVDSAVQSALDWIVSTQLDDGSFDSDLMTTSEVLLAFSIKGGRSHIHTSRCNETQVTLAASDEISHLEILIWIGDNKRDSFSLKVAANSTVYDALLTAQLAGLMRFETQEYPFGHYIVSINNTTQVSNHHRWMIYVLPNNVTQPDIKWLMKTSVSSYKIKSQDRILFRYV